MTKPFPLEPRKVAAACRKAHAEKRLGYQRGHRECRYEYDDGCGCAIGVGMPKGTVPDRLMGAAVAGLELQGIVTMANSDDRCVLSDLQDSHDAMCRNGFDEFREAEFFRVLEDCETA